jgi:hypothetical protein
LKISNLDNHNLGSGSNPRSDTRSTALEGPDQSSEVARLRKQLAEQQKQVMILVSNVSLKLTKLSSYFCIGAMFFLVIYSHPATRKASIAFESTAASFDVPDLPGTSCIGHMRSFRADMSPVMGVSYVGSHRI